MDPISHDEQSHVESIDKNHIIDADWRLNHQEDDEDGISDDPEPIDKLEDTGHTMDNTIFPHVGLQFSTEEQAYDYYNAFAIGRGFSIRIFKSSKKDGLLLSRTYVCSKQGTKDLNDKRRLGREVKRRRVVREKCMARMRVCKKKDDVWEVVAFEDGHSHPLLSTPTKVARLRSHHKAHLHPSCRCLLERLDEGGRGPPTSSIVKTILPQRRDNNLGGSECTAIIQHFMKKRTDDCQFYFAMEIDEDMTCRSIFWADGRARRSYRQLSDVVVFDVRYKTNKFTLPFAPFTGINHHRQSTLFGCALLADEREETFVWLFQQWLDCMWGKAPVAIITDQDPAIKNAIKRVFPTTRHRYCLWHITLHEKERLRPLQCANPTFSEDYRRWAYHSLTIEEAENCWDTLNEKYWRDFEEPLTEKQKNEQKAWKWLHGMYEQRHHWVEPYLKDTFFAGMRSSQKSGNINSFFDTYVNSMTPPSMFIGKYVEALASRREKEEREDTLCMISRHDTQGMHVIEAYASKVYTQNVFRIFQEEFRNVIHCEHEKVVTDGCIKTYKVVVTIDDNISSHLVKCNLEEESCTCTCAKFETEGILCKHILYIMKSKLKLKEIPDRYILPRWTLSVRHSSTAADDN